MLDIVSMADRGRTDPVWWCKEVVGNTLWSKQKEIIESVRDNTRTTVRSCNGAGKSFVSANIVAWFITNFPESIVITTAPTSRQVEEILWQEVARVYNKSKFPLGGRLMKTKWDFGAKWFAMGLSTDEPDRFQGFHAQHILGIIDEACGVEPQIYEAMEAILTSSGARLLLIGNPTEPDGEFFKTFQSPLYNKIHINAYDTPNFTGELGNVELPGLITPQWVKERKQEWGEESPAYQARVLGEFPDVSSTSMIPLSWIMKSVVNEVVPRTEPCILGVDVARFGDDESVIVQRRGKEVEKIVRLQKIDTVDVANQVAQVFYECENCELICVDAVGVGGGVADILRRKGLPAIDINSGEKAYQSLRFNNKRTEMWYRLRELLRLGEIKLPNDELMIGELSSPKYTFDTSGRYVLETKEQMKKRGLKSPNIADAIVYAFAYDGKYQSIIASEQEKQEKMKAGTYDFLLKQSIKSLKEEEDNLWKY